MNMNRIVRHITFSVFAAAALCGCARDPESGTAADSQRYFEAWKRINYPDAVKSGNGIYILEDIPGTGEAWDASLPYTFATYTIRSFTGSVSSNTDEEMARQLGTYDPSYYYGPLVLQTGENVSYAGLDEVLKGMKPGGRRTAIIPSWLVTYDRYDTEEGYLSVTPERSGIIYSITYYGQTANLVKWQYDTLKEYSIREWNQADTTDTGIFFVSHKKPSSNEMPNDTTIYINYTGRLLNGQVFDTTIADTAKVHHIYSASKSYAPVSVTLAAEPSDIRLGGSSVITGVQYGLKLVHPYEKASFAFSTFLGYGASGSGSRVPGYAPLRFDVELVDEP